MYDHYLPIVVAALTVLVLGCWNPRALQTTQNGQPTGCPNYLWLALFALLAGLLSCYLMKGAKGGKGSPEYM
jgi:H+/Cl- antiporter ClcA